MKSAIEKAGEELHRSGAEVKAVQADLSTRDGVEKVNQAIQAAGRPVDALLANASRDLGHALLDQEPDE